jgi:hypothetical protein
LSWKEYQVITYFPSGVFDVVVLVDVVVAVVVDVVVDAAEQSSLFATGFFARSEAELLLQYVIANEAPAASVAWVDVGVSFTCVVLCEYVTPYA